MPGVQVSINIPVSVKAVWDEVSQLDRHANWMADAEAIVFYSEKTQGVGTKIRVPTKVGPFRTSDIIEVTEWIEGHSIGVRHQGLISGVGRFELKGDSGATTFTWTEELQFPWYLGGPLGAWLAAPILRTIWRGNLRRLQAQLIH